MGLNEILSNPPSFDSYFPEVSRTVRGEIPPVFSFNVTYQTHVGLPL